MTRAQGLGDCSMAAQLASQMPRANVRYEHAMPSRILCPIILGSYSATLARMFATEPPLELEVSRPRSSTDSAHGGGVVRRARA